MSRRLKIGAGLLLAAVLLVFFFRQADFGEIVAELRHADYGLVGVATVMSVVTMVLRAWRWRYLLAPLGRVALGPLVSCTMMGWAVTCILPGRLGEVVRPVLLGRREGLSKTAAFATVVLERMFDLLSVLTILGIYLVFFPLPQALDSEARAVLGALRVSGALAVAGLAVAVAFIVALQVRPREAEILLTRLVGLLPQRLSERVFPVARSFVRGFDSFRQPRLLVAVVLHSFVVWGFTVLQYWVLFRAFSLPVPYYAVLPLIVIVVVGIMVPTPGAVGTFHAATRVALVTLWGVPNELAIGYAIVTHAVAFVPVTVIGLLLMAREGLSLATMERLGRSEPGSASAGLGPGV